MSEATWIINLVFQQEKIQVSGSVRNYFPHSPCHVQVASKCQYGIQRRHSEPQRHVVIGCWLIGDTELPLGKRLAIEMELPLDLPVLQICIKSHRTGLVCLQDSYGGKVC